MANSREEDKPRICRVRYREEPEKEIGRVQDELPLEEARALALNEIHSRLGAGRISRQDALREVAEVSPQNQPTIDEIG